MTKKLRKKSVKQKLNEQMLSSAGFNLRRNNALFDRWSIVHLSTGIALGWVVAPLAAIIIMALWEPLEIFLISPMLGRLGITFGFEALVNSLSDILFNSAGVIIGASVLTALVSSPFHLL